VKKRVEGVSPDCLKAMKEYHWPGNVRELENAIQRAMVISEKNYLQPEDLFLNKVTKNQPSFSLENITLEEMEKRLIQQTLDKVRGNRTQAAEILGVSVRTIRNKVKKYGLR